MREHRALGSTGGSRRVPDQRGILGSTGIQSFRLANQVALVNVAGLGAILLSVIPVYLASRLTEDPSAVAGARG